MKLATIIGSSLALFAGLTGTGCTTSVTQADAPLAPHYDDTARQAGIALIEKRGLTILAERIECHHLKMKEFAYLNITASDAAAAVMISCKDIDKKFIESQISPSLGLTREIAEQFVFNLNQSDKQDLRNYIIDLRALRDKAPQHQGSPSPAPNDM
jgi:hypothetical protein